MGQVIFYAIVPLVVPTFFVVSILRWDINLRESTVLGLACDALSSRGLLLPFLGYAEHKDAHPWKGVLVLESAILIACCRSSDMRKILMLILMKIFRNPKNREKVKQMWNQRKKRKAP